MAQRSSAYRSRSFATPSRPPKRRFRVLRRLLLFMVLLALISAAAAIYALHVYAPGLRVEARAVPALVRSQLASHNAPYVRWSQISPDAREAIVAIEDRRFYSHPGVDPRGAVRALLVDVTANHVDQGGSTLEEQLVKRVIVNNDDTIREKVRTASLAWALDQEFSKQSILEMYLNAAYFGQGAYGIESAAHTYFATDAAHLDLAQAAFLAALPQAPSIFGDHPRSVAVVDRQRTVLRDMAEQGYISTAQERGAADTVLTFALPNP